MSQELIAQLVSGRFLIAALISISVFATIFTLFGSMIGGNELKSRMKSVALERDEIRARERARLATEKKNGGKGLRVDGKNNRGVRSIVERLDLKKMLADDKTTASLRAAGFRGQSPLNMFLFLRFTLPIVFLFGALIYTYVLGGFAQSTGMMKMLYCIVIAYAGFYAPIIYVNNKAAKRKQSIQKAWPDALDLLLICVESGMAVESGFRRVSQEIGIQSPPLAEEMVLVGAELSYLSERKQAYENMHLRIGLDAVKSVTQALTQAEKYGTPIGQALRVLAQESRQERLNIAEKKAAALPPKLTVPMILFFLPVLFGVILGPAAIQISARGGIF